MLGLGNADGFPQNRPGKRALRHAERQASTLTIQRLLNLTIADHNRHSQVSMHLVQRLWYISRTKRQVKMNFTKFNDYKRADGRLWR